MTPITTQSPEAENSSYQLDDFQLSESRSVLNVHTASDQLVQTEVSDILIENMDEKDDATTTMHITEDEDTKDSVADILLFTSQAGASETTTKTQYSQPERSPKRIISKGALSNIVENSATLEGPTASETVTSDEVIKGHYHEIQPGQYHEKNPGQYHEENPGQYHETNPGQYHETNPGQYDEKHPGQDLGVDKITVNFDHGEESRSYNVKANAGDFIIGEVGRIDINSGETLEV